jgi:hypothetical protein
MHACMQQEDTKPSRVESKATRPREKEHSGETRRARDQRHAATAKLQTLNLLESPCERGVPQRAARAPDPTPAGSPPFLRTYRVEIQYV